VLFPVLAITTMLAAVALPFWHPAFLVLLALMVASVAARALTSWQTAAALLPFANLSPILATADALAACDGLPTLAVQGIRNDLESLAGLRRIVRWAARDPLSQGEMAGVAQEYLNMLLLLDANAMFFGGRELEAHGRALRRILEWVGQVDLALSVASLRSEPGPWCVPVVSGGIALDIDGVWHPMLDEPVPNSVALTTGTGIIVTGANMSGKTTFLRTVGVAALLARTINTSPSRRWRGPRVAVRTCIQVSDSLAEGKSYYLAEAEAAIAMLEAAGQPEPHLFIVDELFRGTNSVERIAAGEAVLRWLVGPGEERHFVLAATHDGELVELLGDRYRPMHFEEHVAEDRLQFDYRLRPGPATTRSALRLLELLGAPAALLVEARERARGLEGG
jgi:DNA mismatch repair ATPase MutS